MTSRSPLKTLSTGLIVVGVGLTLFPLVWVAYTSLRIGPAQAAALAVWEQEGSGPSVPDPSAPGAPQPSPGLLLTIPRLGITRYVPDGASAATLRKFGVGRISWTALPDRSGTVGIAGHRTTYGAPFFRLGKLERGDHILVTFRGKQFDYTVTEQRIVRPREVEILQATPGEHSVALITCDPLYSARNRLVVLGRLQHVSSPSPNP